jgi:hypothetical protein
MAIAAECCPEPSLRLRWQNNRKTVKKLVLQRTGHSVGA